MGSPQKFLSQELGSQGIPESGIHGFARGKLNVARLHLDEHSVG